LLKLISGRHNLNLKSVGILVLMNLNKSVSLIENNNPLIEPSGYFHAWLLKGKSGDGKVFDYNKVLARGYI
jgi:hypothetical protein